MTSPMVVFGEDWDRHPSSTQHLVRRLAVNRDVLWVNSIGMRRPRLNARDLGRVLGKLGGARAPAVRALATRPQGLTVLSPLAVSWPGSRLAHMANRRLLSRQINGHLQQRGIDRPILWTSLPTALPVVGTLNERAVVYYCGDDFGALAGVDHAPVRAMEDQLVEKADLVLAASEELASRFPRSKTLLVPHGADIDLFSTPAARARDLPCDGPVAGFYGSIADWVDVELLSVAAQRLPNWRFVLIGKVETDIGPLAGRSNLSFLGTRPHSELPGYAQHWQAALLPFRDCPQIRACNPLKLREYLAAGPEIVSTDFPALAPYRDLVSVVTSADDFVAAVAATASRPDRSAERRSRVADETWEARAALVADALGSL